MSVHLHPYLAIIWVVITLASCILAILVTFRPWYRRSCFFTAYVWAYAIRYVILITLSWLNLGWPYTYVYWIGSGLLHGLAFASAYDCFRALFVPFRRLPTSFAFAFITFSCLITAACIVFAYFWPASMHTGMSAAQLTIDRTLSVWICGLFWLLSFASDWLRIPWHRRHYGIGLGFLFLYSVDLFMTTVRSFTPWHLAPYLFPIGFATDAVCVAVWIFYFARKEPELETPTSQELEEIYRTLDMFRTHWKDRSVLR